MEGIYVLSVYQIIINISDLLGLLKVMYNRELIYKFLSFCAVFILSSPFAIAATYLEIDAEPGEFLFGSDITVTEADGTFNLSFSAPDQLSGGFTWREPTASKNNIQLTFFSGYWQFMQAGSYLNAVGPGWQVGQKQPSLDVHLLGAGRACSPNAGEFFIYEFEPQAVPPRYAINFTQSCYYGNQAKIRGVLRINSNYPKYDLDPIAVISSTSTTAIEGGEYILSAAQSRSESSEIISYQWTQVDGPTVNFGNDKAINTSVKLPKGVALGGERIDLQLTVTNAAGYSNSTVLKLYVASKSDPRSFFRLVSGTRFPEKTDEWDVNIEGDNLIFVNGGRSGINAEIRSSTASFKDYFLTMGPPQHQDFGKGVYVDAARFSNTKPVLDFAAFSYGCNQVFGEFEVLDLVSENDEMVRYHARFTHYCESPNAIPSSGEIAFNILDPNVPTIKVQAPTSVVEGQTFTLDASGSFDNIGKIVSYEWFASGDLPINNRNSAVATAVAPAMINGNPPYLNFSLHITDDEGYQASKLVSVKLMPATKSSASASSVSATVSSASTTVPKSGGGGGAGSPYLLFLLFLIFAHRTGIAMRKIK